MNIFLFLFLVNFLIIFIIYNKKTFSEHFFVLKIKIQFNFTKSPVFFIRLIIFNFLQTFLNMDLYSQIALGIRKEFAAFKHNPKKLFDSYFSVISTCFLAIFLSNFLLSLISYLIEFLTEEILNLKMSNIWIASAQAVLYFSPANVVILKVSLEREADLQRFVKVSLLLQEIE